MRFDGSIVTVENESLVTFLLCHGDKHLLIKVAPFGLIALISRASELRAGELRAGELRAGELRVSELRAGELRAGELRAGELRAGGLS